MALQGKFIVNDADFSPLIFYGVGTFLAYSGNDQYRNRAGCVGIPDNGPIPSGRYYIVKRPSGGWKGVIRTDLHDFYSWPTSTPVIKYEWFALYRDDGKIDDHTWVSGNWHKMFGAAGDALSISRPACWLTSARLNLEKDYVRFSRHELSSPRVFPLLDGYRQQPIPQ